MSIDEMKVMRDTLSGCITEHESAMALMQRTVDAEAKVENLRRNAEEDRAKIERLSDHCDTTKRANDEIRAEILHAQEERDDARRRLKEAVLMLEEMWRDYKQINFKSKADKKRAKEMAAKIKAWSDAKEFCMVQTKKGEWVAK